MTKLAVGPLGDRFAKRPLIATGYGMAALGKVIIAVAAAWPGVLAGRVVDRLGKGIRGAPRDALLVDGVDKSLRGKVFGFHRAMDTLGAVVGPLLGLAGYELLDHQIPPLLYIAIVPAVLSVFLVFLVREARTAGARSRRTPTDPSRVARTAAAVLASDLVAGRLWCRQLSRRVIAVAAQRDRLRRRRSDPRLRRVQPGVRAGQLPGRGAGRQVAPLGGVRLRAGLLRRRLHRARVDHRSGHGVVADRGVRDVHRVHRRCRESLDLNARRGGPAGQRAGSVPGRQRFRGADRRPVGRIAVGQRWPAPAADLRSGRGLLRGGAPGGPWSPAAAWRLARLSGCAPSTSSASAPATPTT